MAIALVQSKLGGNFSGSGSGPSAGNFTSSAVAFDSPTTAGNLVVIVTFLASQQTSGQLLSSQSPSSPTTPAGVTWLSPLLGTPGYTIGGISKQGNVAITYMANAPAISTAISAKGTVVPNATTNYNVQLECVMYEFSGIATSSVLDPGARAGNNGSASAPTVGNITTTAIDLILAAYCGDPTGANVTAGSGYTLGPNATVALYGQSQYQLNVPAGTVATAFGSSFSGSWGAGVAAFKPGAAAPSFKYSSASHVVMS